MDAPDTLIRHISPTVWRGYNCVETDEMIREDFTMRYGYTPDEIIRKPGYATVLAGPVRQETHDANESDTPHLP